MESVEQQRLITEEKIISPLVEVLNYATPKSDTGNDQTREVPKTISQSLDVLFPEQEHEEKDIQKAKEILGARANELSNEQLKDIVTEIQYLSQSWLDDFERQIFKGLTLKELLHEKVGI